MKRILATLLLLTALLIPVCSAGAATPQAKQIAALQKQMKTTQKQVKTLKTQVKTLQSQVKTVNAIANVNWSATACSLAMVADTFQATWKALDSNETLGAIFDFSLVGSPLNDYSACSDLDLTRQKGLSVPSWTAYNSLIAFLYGP